MRLLFVERAFTTGLFRGKIAGKLAPIPKVAPTPSSTELSFVGKRDLCVKAKDLCH